MLRGDRAEETVWVNRVPEPLSVKQRVHLDIRAESVAEIEALGATMVDPDTFPWAVMKDPEGGELCVFGTQRKGPDKGPGFMEIVIDTTEDHAAIAGVVGRGARCAGAGREARRRGVLLPGAGADCPWDDLVFVPVPSRRR